MNSSQLFQEIKDDINAIQAKLLSLIGEELGTWQNGQPAIWQSFNVPSTMRTTGLRCVIDIIGHGDAIPTFTHTIEDTCYLIELVNFASDNKLAIAKLKIQRNFDLKRSPLYQGRSELTLERCQFWVMDFRAIARA